MGIDHPQKNQEGIYRSNGPAASLWPIHQMPEVEEFGDWIKQTPDPGRGSKQRKLSNERSKRKQRKAARRRQRN